MILIVAAHPDDEVLGCGASIAKWSESGEEVYILIMAEGATSRDESRNVETKKTELSALAKSAKDACKVLGAASVKLLACPDNRMDSLDLLDVVKLIETEIEQLSPHTVVTHHCGDVNIDHRIIHEAVTTACRPLPGSSVRRILAFEVPSSTEWQTSGSNAVFQPNWFEDVSKTLVRKMDALKYYEAEMRDWQHPRSFQAIEHLARWRGATVGCEAAEAFILLREIT